LVYFEENWYISPRFGMLHQKIWQSWLALSSSICSVLSPALFMLCRLQIFWLQNVLNMNRL
jgi:hypothetical protein